VLGIEHPREGSRKMSLEGEGYDTLKWGARRGDTSLLPKSFKTQRERGGGLREGAEAERQRNTQSIELIISNELSNVF